MNFYMGYPKTISDEEEAKIKLKICKLLKMNPFFKGGIEKMKEKFGERAFFSIDPFFISYDIRYYKHPNRDNLPGGCNYTGMEAFDERMDPEKEDQSFLYDDSPDFEEEKDNIIYCDFLKKE